MLLKKILLIGFFLALCFTVRGQNISLTGTYIYKKENSKDAWTLILKQDSTFKWYFTGSKDTAAGHWKFHSEEILLHNDSTKKETKFNVIAAEDSERPVIYRKKEIYLKKH